MDHGAMILILWKPISCHSETVKPVEMNETAETDRENFLVDARENQSAPHPTFFYTKIGGDI